MISFHFTTLNEISETTKPPPNGRRKETAIASQHHKQFSSASEQEAKWESPGFATMGEVVVGISGASGAIYGKRLAEVLSEMGKTVRLVVTDSGKITLKHECDTTPEAVAKATNAILEDAKNVGAKSASGSAKIDAVVICPCSGTTIGKLAAGISDNLVTRSAIVALKERRKLIIVPREAPMLRFILKTWQSFHNGAPL